MRYFLRDLEGDLLEKLLGKIIANVYEWFNYNERLFIII